MDGDLKISTPQIPASAGDTASSVSGATSFYIPSPGGEKMAEADLGNLQMAILADPKSSQSEQPASLSNPSHPSASASATMSTLHGPQEDPFLGGSTSRTQSHRFTSTSPRCTFAWIAKCGLLRSKPAPRPCSPFLHSIRIPRSEVKHVLGKGGRVLSRIEDLSGCLVSVVDSSGRESTVNLMGGDATLGCFLVHALSSGFFSVFETLERNGITRVCPEWFAG